MKLDTQTKTKSDLLTWFEWLYSNKTTAAWIAFIALSVALVLKDFVPSLYVGCILLYLAAITAILLDIHRHIEPPVTRFPSHSAANPTVFEEIEKAVKQGRGELCWLGVTMTSAWLTLENKLRPLIAKKMVSNLTVRLLQSSPEYLETILGEDDPMCEFTRRQHVSIVEFARRYRNELEKSNSCIEIAQYSYMPNFHGLLINNSVLFLSTVRWEGPNLGDLSVPHEPFERFDRSTEKGEYMIQLFTSWFQKGWGLASPSDVTQAPTPPPASSASSEPTLAVEPAGSAASEKTSSADQ